MTRMNVFRWTSL